MSRTPDPFDAAATAQSALVFRGLPTVDLNPANPRAHGLGGADPELVSHRGDGCLYAKIAADAVSYGTPLGHFCLRP